MAAPRTRPRLSRRGWVLVVGAALLVVALVAAWFVATSQPRRADTNTEVVRATRSTQTATVSLSGTLSPQQQANVSFSVPGTVRTVEVKVGQSVNEGQRLATVDDRDLRDSVRLAEAQLSAARASVQTARDAQRSTSAQVEAARAQVAASEASLAQARTRLADAALTSPLTGVVAEVSLEVGDQVSGLSRLGSASSGSSGASGMGGLSGMAGGAAGSAQGGSMAGLGGLSGSLGSAGLAGANAGTSTGRIVVVVPDAWELEATVGTADLPHLRAGQRAVVTPTGTETHVDATVSSVGIVATSTSGQAATFPVTLTIDRSDTQLFSGSNADAVVTTETVPGVLTVPGSAITASGDRTSVRMADESPRDVVTGRTFGDRIEIVSGLAEGDQVLVPRGVVVTAPPRPQYGPGGSLASPDPSPSRR